jgi:transposase/DNA-binding transcriptional MerR regulator
MVTKPSLSREESAERASRVAAAVADGGSVKSVADEFGISVGTVYDSCRRKGVVLRRSDTLGYHALAAARRRQVVLEALRGATHRDIAAKLGFKEDSIRRICSDAGVALRPVVRSNEARVLRERQEVAARHSHLASEFSREQLAILLELGDVRRSIQQVADDLGCSRGHVWQVFRLAKGRLATLAKTRRLPSLPALPDPVQQRLSAPHLAVTPRPRRRPAGRATPQLSAAERAQRAARAAARIPKMPAKAVAERRRKIAASVVSGLSAAQAATKFNVSVGAVYDARRDSGWGATGAVSPAEARRLAILQLAMRGNFADTIATRLEVTERYVRSLCKRRGVNLQSRRDRIEAARVLARHHKLKGVDLRMLLDGRDLRILKALRDTDLTLADIGKRLRAPGQSVFNVWTRALDRLAVPLGSSHDQYIAARRRVFSSGISLNALCKAVGGHQKLVQQLRRSSLSIDQLARNARMSVGAVMRIWYFALDRAAIVEARLGPVAPRSTPRRRRTKRERRVLRDLVL